MREDIHFGPAREIELCAGGQEIEAGPGKVGAALACQTKIKLFAQAVQVEDI